MSASANLRPGANSFIIRLGQAHDVSGLTHLINAAFRVEQPFIEGDRTNPEGVRAYMKTGEFLLAEDSSGLVGCVYVEVRGDRGYLGLLGVEPKSQGAGLGRKLMEAAENFFREAGCRAIELRIISARTPLPAFYRHLGYVETGIAPFSAEVQTKVPCHYILMSKGIA